MLYTLDSYLTMEKALEVNELMELHKTMRNEIGLDADAMELYEELVQKSIEYATVRARWTLMSAEKKADADNGRTLTHDSLIVKFNQLARYLRMQGKPADWRDSLGYEEDNPMNRKRIGDMACYISFVHGICAR